jgi:RNA polymerase sigma-70 factor, ECF subfamily
MTVSAAALPNAGRPRSLSRRPAPGAGGRSTRSQAKALQRRDRAALEGVYGEYAPTVLGYLINVLGDRGAAEDVHQQVFLEVWQRASSYDPERASIFTWIMTIARSRAIDQKRRRVPEPQDPGQQGEIGRAEDDDPERSPDALVERWRMAHLLSRLRPEESELLRMRFYEGLSQTEIAERTEIPLGTVKMRMVGALRRLRDMIQDEETP